MENKQYASFVIDQDEPGFNLVEIDLTAYDFTTITGFEMAVPWKGEHRFQKIQVIRDDDLKSWWRDLGASENFPMVGQFHIPGGQIHRDTLGNLANIEIWDTVGGLVDAADNRRGQKSLFIGQIEPTPLWQAWEQVMEDSLALPMSRSTFGYGGQRIRGEPN